jgi:hypothetical protein
MSTSMIQRKNKRDPFSPKKAPSDYNEKRRQPTDPTNITRRVAPSEYHFIKSI